MEIETMQCLTGFQHWLGTNYKTLPTDSGEMTKRARLYLNFLKQKECKHDFREFFKTRFGMLKLKEVKCIYCSKIK